ncbi:hypothetical protein DN062_10020 [Nitrincola tibetensis]|uniref:Uncharacterized protein n=1 Tax=Nitrincola tibetensis TaxID=2219697 RepID=A0A364NMJ2_9GAMM|nr:hypothetical protein [Nitrincola tibetensis]RAU18107.1 hypothetical protein DN062_10020 [Nitrincola tibetensis]
MSITLPLPQDKKITFTCRVEAGCLGPDGQLHVKAFCQHAEKEIAFFDTGVIQWRLVPRHDKSEEEIQYSIASKILTREQAARYFSLLDRDIEDIENFFHGFLVRLINEYLGHE